MNYERTIYNGSEAASLATNEPFVAKVHEAVASGFQRPDFDYEDTRYHLKADYVAVAHDTESNVAGFLSGKFGKAADMLPGVDLGEVGEQQVAYLFGTAVHPEHKGNGLYSQLAADFIREARERGHTTILFSTQNPHVEAGFDRALAQVGEQGEKIRIPIPGRYGRLLTGDLPAPLRHGDIQSVYEGLRRDAGDAFAVVYTLGQPVTKGRRRPF